MAQVTVERLTKRFGGRPPTVAADSLDLDIVDGEFLVLLGPSGCGKTTTLRCLAGLEEPDEGRILLDGEPVFDAAAGLNLPPDRRSIGMVFQSYALWPHLSVRRNIEYPLRSRKLKQGLADGWADDVADLVDCTELMDRLPGQLSGGQQQRIALARGLVARPGLMLFDEPLSNLDAKLRDAVRSELHELHRRLGFTAVFVTHDQAEAFALGDRLVILRAGGIEQVDAARRVWNAPASDYVAEFIGMTSKLLLERRPDGWSFMGQPLSGARLPIDRTIERVVARLRPHDLAVLPPDGVGSSDMAHLPATFVDSTFAGDGLDVTVEVAGVRLQATAPVIRGSSWIDELQAGGSVLATFAPDRAHFFDAASGVPVQSTAARTSDPLPNDVGGRASAMMATDRLRGAGA